MSCLSEFITIVTSPGEPDFEAFHSVLDKVITADGECVPADADDIENIKKQFLPETASLVAEHASRLRWLSQILINQCIMHFDASHQQLLEAFLDRLVSTESKEYLNVLYAAKHYFSSVNRLLQSAALRERVDSLDVRLAAHQLSENHANKLMLFLKAGSGDAYASERLLFLEILKGSAEAGSPFQWPSIMKDAQGRCTPFALMAMKSLSAAEFILYVNQLQNQADASVDQVVVTSYHRDMLHQALNKLTQAQGMDEVVRLLALLRFLGMGVDVKEARGRDILMAFFSKRLSQRDDFSRLLAALNTNLKACFEVYQHEAPEKRVGPVDGEYMNFLKDKFQGSPEAIFHYLTLPERQSLPVMICIKLAQDAGLDYPGIRATLTEIQSKALFVAVSQKTRNSPSLLEMRENLLSAHAWGMDLGALECDLLNTLPNLDKETALLLFTSKALQAQSRAYVVRDGGAWHEKEVLSYEGLNRIIFTALLALDPEVYQRPGNESLGLTSFEEAFKYWMITMTFQHRDRASYENAIFHDNFQSKITTSVGGDDCIYYTRDPRGFARPKLCTDKALEAPLKAAKANDTPETLAQDTPIDHGQIAAMLALKKMGFRYNRHGVKHAFQVILDMRSRLKNAICDHALLGESEVPGLNLLENILMSHESSENLSVKTKQYQSLLAARKKQPISPEGLPLLKAVLANGGVNYRRAIFYLAFHLDLSDEEWPSVIEKHLLFKVHSFPRTQIEAVFDLLNKAQLDSLKTRLVSCVLSNARLKAAVSEKIKDRASYVLFVMLCLQPTSVMDRIFDDDAHSYYFQDTNHWKALVAYLDEPNQSGALLAKFGKFAGLSLGEAPDEGASLVVRRKK